MANECEDYKASLTETRRRLNVLKVQLRLGTAAMEADILASEVHLAEAEKEVPALESWAAILGRKGRQA